MKKISLLFLTGMLALVLVLIFTGCAPAQTTSTTKATPTSTMQADVVSSPQDQLSSKPIELKFAHHLSSLSSFAVSFAEYSKKVEEQCNGKVKITIYPSESLFKHVDTYDSILGGIADISYFTHSVTAGRFPLSIVGDLPLIPISNQTVYTQVITELYDKFPALQAEHPGVKILGHLTPAETIIHTKNKPVETLNDLKGLKMRSVGSLVPVVSALGAIAVSIPVTDLYPSLEKGVVNSAAIAWSVMGTIKAEELLRCHTETNLGYVSGGVIMNLKTWDSLPADVQKVFTDNAPTLVARCYELEGANGNKFKTSCIEKYNDTVNTISQEEMENWKEKMQPLWDSYVKTAEAKGLPGRAVLDELITLGQKYSK
jgi:TRAP-type C4-dicarboxylate transport system substrate-binding protein